MGFNYDFNEYDNPGLPPLYAIENSGFQEYFGDKSKELSKEGAGFEGENFHFSDKDHLSIWSFTDHIKSKGFNYGFVEYDNPGCPSIQLCPAYKWYPSNCWLWGHA